MNTVPCKSCGKPVIWVQMRASGKRMPVDAAPMQAGTEEPGIVVSVDGLARVLRGATTATKFVSHFATCPNAKNHRRSR